MSLEYWAPHEDPEGKTTELDLVAASTITLAGLVAEVRRKIAENTRPRDKGSFMASLLPGGFYLRDTPETGRVRIVHSAVVRRAVAGSFEPGRTYRAHYEIFKIPDGLSSSVTQLLEEHYAMDPRGGQLFYDGEPLNVPPDTSVNKELLRRQIVESGRWAEAEQAERQLGIDFLSEAGARRLHMHVAAATGLAS